MQDKINGFMKYARDAKNKVIAKIKKEEDMEDKDLNIESYDGDDAFYSGNDEDYEEFLKSVDGKMNSTEEAEPVENTQKINLNLGDTINIQSVIDKFKQKAGEFGTAAKNVKDDVAEKIEDFKAASAEKNIDNEDDDEDDGETRFEKCSEIEKIANDIRNFDVEGIKTQISDSVKGSMEKFGDFKEGITSITDRFDATDEKVGGVSDQLNTISDKVGELAEKLQLIEIQQMENSKEKTQSDAELKHSVGNIVDDVAEIKQAVSSVSKLNDSIFDLKNAQMNTKNSLAELESSFVKLKRKCVVGVTILSLLGAITIALEIIQLLS
jgi:methyl-accepting chemotaxis protein